MKKISYLLVSMVLISACSAKPVVSNNISLSGTIVENPAHLAAQPPYMFIDSAQNKLLGYIESSKVALSDFTDREGTIEGIILYQSQDAVPTIEISTFTPSKPLSEEDILLSTLRRESKKNPFNYRWTVDTAMLILQRDNSNGSAQVQVSDSDKKYMVSLVKNRNDWHIADIKQVEYSSEENLSSTGSSLQPSPFST